MCCADVHGSQPICRRVPRRSVTMTKLVSVRRTLGMGLAGAVALIAAAGSVTAAPVVSNSAAVKSAATSVATEARWRHHVRRYRGYAYNSGCHVEGGYHRPNGCW